MKKVPHHEPNNAGVVILVLFVIAALGQCFSGKMPAGHPATDACGGPGSHPVMVGGMVIACH